MNNGIQRALDSVAAAAAAKLDMNMCSVLQEAACLIGRCGSAYDTTAYNASATAFVVPNGTQQLDVIAAVAKINSLTNQQLGG